MGYEIIWTSQGNQLQISRAGIQLLLLNNIVWTRITEIDLINRKDTYQSEEQNF